jgi:hypothetical protein
MRASPLDRFVGATLKAALIAFGLATCLPIPLTIDIGLGNRVLFRGGLEPTPSVDLIVRHWGFMICGIGVLMIASAFLPLLRIATMSFAAAEKVLLVAMVAANLGQPWGRDYLTPRCSTARSSSTVSCTSSAATAAPAVGFPPRPARQTRDCGASSVGA